MARFKFGRPISLRWNGLLVEGPAETVFEIPDEYYEEFNEDIGGVEPTLVWLDSDEASTIRARVTALELASTSFAILDAKGDLISATADNTAARLGVGANGTVLTADSSTATGLAWTEPSGVADVVREYVKNNSGGTINKGQAVYVSGADGTNVLVQLADYDTDETSSKTLGLMEATVANNEFGYVVTQGRLNGFDTTAASAAGVPVWLGAGGNLVYGTAPSEPNHTVYIGVVTRKNVSNGEVFIKVQNGYELTELHDVSAASPADNDIIQFDSASGYWKNETLSNAGISATSHAHTGVYDPAGTAAAAIVSHEADSDPHPTYLTSTEGNAAYAATVHTHGAYLEYAGDTLTGALTVSNTGSIGLFGATSTANTQLTTRVDGDASTRWGVRADGFQAWGDGTAARDTNLYRSAANTLATDDNLDVGQDLTVGGDIIHTGQMDFISGGSVAASFISSGLYLPPGKTVMFEGTSNDSSEVILTAADATADRTITLPDSSGTVALTSQLTPAGSVTAWLGSNASVPSGWLMCAGATVSRSTYSDLFSVIGTTFGAGDGSTTFGLPNLTGHMLVGASVTAPTQTGTGDAYLNATWDHDHTVNVASTTTSSDSHSHTVDPIAVTSGGPSTTTAVASGGGTTVASSTHTHSTNVASTTSSTDSHTHTVNPDSVNSGAMIVSPEHKRTRVNYIIKT